MLSPAEGRHESLLYTPFENGGVFVATEVHVQRSNVELIGEWMEAHPGECGDCYVNPGLCDEHDLGIIGYEDDGEPIVNAWRIGSTVPVSTLDDWLAWRDFGGEA